MITRKTSINIILLLLSAIIIFHLLILVKIIPYEVTWGGRLKSEQEMYIFVSTSILVNLFLGFIIIMKGGFIKQYFRQSLIDTILWIFLIIFVLNTFGNLFAKTNFEKSFAIFTIILSFLLGIVLKKKRNI